MRPIPIQVPVAFLACALALLLGTGCYTHGRALAEVTPEINATLDTEPVRLVPGDTLMVRFPDKEEWEQTVKVRLDGRASFLAIGEMAVGGLTLPEAEARVREAYAKVFPQLVVSLGTTSLATRNIFVFGEVHEPGAFPIEGRMSLFEALGHAGGPLKATAMLENTLLVRWAPQERRQRFWNIDAAIEAWNVSEPLLLQPYDVIFVPNIPIDNINIWIDQYIRLMIPFPYLIPSPY